MNFEELTSFIEYKYRVGQNFWKKNANVRLILFPIHGELVVFLLQNKINCFDVFKNVVSVNRYLAS